MSSQPSELTCDAGVTFCKCAAHDDAFFSVRQLDNAFAVAGAPLTSEGRKLKWARKRLLKWDELLNPIE
jgi:hypothetical protein